MVRGLNGCCGLKSKLLSNFGIAGVQGSRRLTLSANAIKVLTFCVA